MVLAGSGGGSEGDVCFQLVQLSSVAYRRGSGADPEHVCQGCWVEESCKMQHLN